VDDAAEPVADDELLYRRIPASTNWFDPVTGTLQAAAFAPHKTSDLTGLSVSRAKYKSIENAARARPGKSYFIAVLRAGDLRQSGIEVVPRPLPGDPGHAELPALNSGSRKSTETLEMERLLAETLCLQVEGPFTTPAE